MAGHTAEEGKHFATAAFKIDDFTRFGWMVNSNPDMPTLKLEDFLDTNIIKNPLADNFNLYSYNNANEVTPGPAFTTAAVLDGIAKANKAFSAHVPVYGYNFSWARQPAPWNVLYGAWHTEDLPYLFGNFNKNINCFGWSKANEPGRKALSNAMQKSIAAFARTGDPSHRILGAKWNKWTPETRREMVFDATYKKAKTYMSEMDSSIRK